MIVILYYQLGLTFSTVVDLRGGERGLASPTPF